MCKAFSLGAGNLEIECMDKFFTVSKNNNCSAKVLYCPHKTTETYVLESCGSQALLVLLGQQSMFNPAVLPVFLLRIKTKGG